MSDRTLYLERPSFWTEERDPECWYRGLKALAELEREEGVIRGTPRSLWQRHLKPVLSRRSILGLFGMAPDREEDFLLGVGFLEYDSDQKGWKLANVSKPLLAENLKDRKAPSRSWLLNRDRRGMGAASLATGNASWQDGLFMKISTTVSHN